MNEVRDWLHALHDISALSTGAESRGQAPGRAIGMVRDALGCDAASLFLFDPESGEPVELASAGGTVLGADDTRFPSIISATILSGDRRIGVISLGHCAPDAFTADHRLFLELAAHCIAPMLEPSGRGAVKEAGAPATDGTPGRRIASDNFDIFRELGRMAVSLNHEINNPLTAIIGNADLLLITASGLDDDFRKKIETIISEAQRIADIIDRFGRMKKDLLRSGEYSGLNIGTPEDTS